MFRVEYPSHIKEDDFTTKNVVKLATTRNLSGMLEKDNEYLKSILYIGKIHYAARNYHIVRIAIKSLYNVQDKA